MGEWPNETNKWARINLKHEGWGQSQYKVDEVRVSDSKPDDGTGEWCRCYDHTQVGWYFLHGIFVSLSQMTSYFRSPQLAPNGKEIHPRNPVRATIKIIIGYTMETHYFCTVDLDINNTSLDNLKKIIMALAKKHFNGIENEVIAIGATKTITADAIEESNKIGYRAKEALGRRILSAATRAPVSHYADGKNHVTNEPKMIVVENDWNTLTWFNHAEDTVVAEVRQTGREQISPFNALDWVLGSMVPK
jgi:hypothetical protein